MLDIGSLNFPFPPRTILQQITKNLKLCTHVCIRLWNIQFHCTFHRVQSARSINSKSLLLSLFLVFSKRISLTESGCSRFLRKARDRKMRGIVSSSLWNYWPRFDERRKRRASKDARLIFLQTNFSRNRVYIEDNLIRRLASNNDSPYHSIFLFLNRYHLFSFNSKRVNTRIISSKRKLKKEGPEF